VPKSTAIRLTASLCKEARHSLEHRVSPSGRTFARKEILWDSDLRGLGLRLHPNGRIRDNKGRWDWRAGSGLAMMAM
jgi:hypothetical protein